MPPLTSPAPVNACTIIARNYLAHARVLAESFLEHHPEGQFSVLVLDAPPEAPGGPDEPFTTITPYEIGIDRAELHRMAMIYDVMEFATSVKPWLLRTLLDRGASDVTYFDPDIQIFAPLDDVSALARRHSIVLIPHVTEPMPDDGRVPNETTILEAGIYNLGFIAVGEGARPFLDWWSKRLARECLLAPERSRFVDQRWVDFVPAMFDHFILRDPGCDVAHWNLWGRTLAWTGDRYEVDGVPLRFYHFSGFDPEQPDVLSKHQGASPRLLLDDNPALRRLCRQYAERLLSSGYRATSTLPYRFGTLPNGIRIDRDLRTTYRTALLASEEAMDDPPPDPFEPSSASAFAGWLRRTGHVAGGIRGVQPKRPFGINIAGYLRAELGIGEAARQVVTALTQAKVPFAAITYREATQSRQDHPEVEAPETPVYDTNLICVNADGMAGFAATVRSGFFEGRYSIGLWWWEVSVFPPSMYPGFVFVDEVWVGSDHARTAIAAQTTKPVVKIPMPVAMPPTEPMSRAELGLPEDFLFLFTFDFLSVLERKNPLGLVEAFKRAFAPGEGPKLVLKSINGDKCLAELRRLEDAAAGHPDIVVLDRYVSAGEKNAMAASCDCYVSLHRSEGFGLTMAEAMLYGKPVIATAYSGNLEFMDDDNSYLVPYTLAIVPQGCEPYPAGAEWADPDLDAAAELMRHVFEHQDEAAARGLRAREDVLSRHDPARAGAFMRERLEEIRRERPALLAGDLLAHAATHVAPQSPVRRAAAVLMRVPSSLAVESPRRGTLTKIVRKGLLWALWPYIREQHELNGAVVEALGEIQEAHARQAELLSRLTEADGGRQGLQRRNSLGRVDVLTKHLGPLPVGAELRMNDGVGVETFGFRGGHAPTRDDWYVEFEGTFRGPEPLVRERQRVYLELLAGRPPVLDVGCGRGEFLELLREAGVEARGVDHDRGMVARAHEKGLDVEFGDAIDYLEAQPDESLGAVFCAQVIEHLPYDRLMRFLEHCRRKLVPGGLLVAETVNPHSLVAFRAFWRDPTHQSPIYPEVAVVLCRIHGFESASVHFPNGTGELERDLREADDYAIVAFTGERV